jgi:hypothetical protein
LEDLTKGVENVISTLQNIARQRTVPEHKEESNSESRPGTANSTSVKRSEKVRQMIDFQLPNDTLGPNGVNESNLIQFLGLVENKANELLTLNFLVNSPKKAMQLAGEDGILIPAGGVAGLLGPGPHAPIGTLSIIPPSTAYSHINVAMIMILEMVVRMRMKDRLVGKS